MPRTLYQITDREVSPVNELLKAVVEVNWHVAAAYNAGWSITLDITADTGELAVTVARTGCWPDADSEAEAAVE